jgi:hypothetical protein
MTRRGAVFVLAFLLGSTGATRAADLQELAKYLGFIESFQQVFESCQAEVRLPDNLIRVSRDHIAQRRALIFAGLNDEQRRQISAAAAEMRGEILAQFMRQAQQDAPDKELRELCKIDGFFAGIVESETKSDAGETAAIGRAKN